MTKLSQVLKVTLREQLRMLTKTFLFYLLVVLVSFILSMFSKEARQFLPENLLSNVAGWSVLFMIIYFIRLALSSKNFMKSNRFRLIPIATSKLYIANILTIFIGLVYVEIMHLVLLILSLVVAYFEILGATIKSSDYQRLLNEILLNNNFISGSIGSLLLVLLSPILIIILFHLIDFTSSLLLNYIPGGAQKLVKIVVYILVIIVAVYLISNIVHLIYLMFSGTFLNDLNLIWINMIVVGLGLIIFSWINIMLLKNVETVS
ncbi:hypothetical protein GYW21_08345 [Lactobacillus mellis]|nr:hypothetical protein [Bombilactobacillus mellis]